MTPTLLVAGFDYSNPLVRNIAFTRVGGGGR
jgi:hypothetical protein